jgi:tetratricopeptide (TPR) repeat protein
MKKNMLLILALFISITVLGQNNYTKGWEYFNQNELEDARDEFLSAAKSSNNKSNAYLSLAIANSVNKEHAIVHESFMSFLENEKDINPYLYSFWYSDMFAYKNKLSKDLFKYIISLLESGKLNFTNTAYANLTIARHFRTLHKHDKAFEYEAKVGNIKDWQVVGNFDNISGSGFEKGYEPVQISDNDHEFTNRNGAPVKWFTISKYRDGRWIDFGNHMYTTNSICYAQTFVKSTKDQEVILNIGVTGSVKCWVNDMLVYAQEEERDVSLDAYQIKVKLKSGYNRLVIQVGESVDVDDSQFFVRFSDLNHKLLTFNVSAEPKPYEKADSYTPEVLKHFAEDYFEKLEKRKPESILAKFLLQKIYRRLDKNFEARKVLLEARELAPISSLIASQLMLVYDREDANTLLSKLLEEVKKTDPENPIALQLLYGEAIDKEDWTEAGNIIDKIEYVKGKNQDVFAKRISLLLEEEKIQEAISLIFEANAKYPDNMTFVYYKYLVYNSRKNPTGAFAVLKKYYKKNFTTDVLELMADHMNEMGNRAMFIKYHKELLELYPYLPDYYLNLAGQYEAVQNYEMAIDYLNQCMENAPFVGSFFSRLADNYKEEGDDAEAKEAYEKAILYEPNDFETREKYRKFVGLKEVFEYFDEPDLYTMYAESESADKYPEDNSLIVYNETQRVIYYTGGAEQKHYVLIKVFNKTGVDQWKDYSIGYDGRLNVEKAEVLKKDGDQLKAEVNGSRVIFTDLEEGDAILLIYKVKKAQYGRLLKHFWDYDYMQHYFPIKTQKYNLLVEGDRQFTHKVTHSDIKPVVKKEDDDFTMYSWVVENVESVKEESYMTSLNDFVPVLHYTSFPDWNFVNEWYYDISTTKAKSNFEVQQTLKEILKGHENLTAMDSVKLIYNYVVKEIRYSSVSFRQSGIVPQKASKTINTRIGDCKDVATLFIALCREAGFKARIMLVNTRDNGEDDLALPSINFNHAISKVWVEGKPYVVELTSDYLPFSTMGYSLKKAFVLDIDNSIKSEPYQLDMPTRQPNKIRRYGTVTITDDGNMEVQRVAVRYGDYAAAIRSSYRDIGEEKRIKEITNAISDEFAKIKVHKLEFDSALYTTEDSVKYTYDFTVYDPFLTFENKKLLKMPLSIKQKPLDFLNDERKYPLALWNYINDDSRFESITIISPSNMVLSSLPKNKHFKSKFGEYWLTFKRQGNDIVITRKIVFTVDVVQVEDYEEFANFFKNIIKADETQIGYRVK